jgi:hypothetical protein
VEDSLAVVELFVRDVVDLCDLAVTFGAADFALFVCGGGEVDGEGFLFFGALPFRLGLVVVARARDLGDFALDFVVVLVDAAAFRGSAERDRTGS